MALEIIIKEKQCIIVNVQTPEEFSGGHVVESINIPLNEVQERFEEIKNLKSPLVFCCASGNRSGQA